MLRFIQVIVCNLPRMYMIPRMAYMAKHPEKYSEADCYKYANLAITRMMKSGHITTQAYGLENLPKEGGYIMFPNHQGKYDALGILHTHTKPCSIVIDDAKSHMILTSQFIDLLKGKRMVKDDLRQSVKVIKELSEEAKAGRKFIIFPEGGYYHNHNKVRDFKPGSFKSAMKAKVPIVPVVLIDSYRVFEEWSLRRVKTQVHYLPAVYYDEYKDMTAVEVSEMVHDRIKEYIEKVLRNRL
ncbi:MAG: 1-acyl-sn-glycerol-3-phosphate acyltransferase [Lachnospiraceae bacterium]|nr:1-acyl-sn-glycerol-3-phosphate acyltransferase [Lachnospiraceae bacterium]